MRPEDIAKKLNLDPHPEGGYYRRVYTHETKYEGERGLASSIYFLLEGGMQTRWHKTDGDELWLWHAGSPILLSMAQHDVGPVTTLVLGANVFGGEHPQLLILENHWQSAKVDGLWALVSCVVSPEFTFDKYIMADDGWFPGK
jgi:uncharacterized protein